MGLSKKIQFIKLPYERKRKENNLSSTEHFPTVTDYFSQNSLHNKVNKIPKETFQKAHYTYENPILAIAVYNLKSAPILQFSNTYDTYRLSAIRIDLEIFLIACYNEFQ